MRQQTPPPFSQARREAVIPWSGAAALLFQSKVNPWWMGLHSDLAKERLVNEGKGLKGL